MNQNIFEYLAEKVIEDLRKEREFSEGLLRELNKYPQIDFIRDKVQLGDIELLLSLIDKKEDTYRSLAMSLLYKVKDDNRVRSFLLSKWNQVHDYLFKSSVMWRLLDYPDLGIIIHKEFYSFVIQNWERFLKDSIDWFDHPDNILPGIKSRLSNPSFPKTKYWIYLCQSIASPDEKGGRELLANFTKSENAFTSGVAMDLHKLLDNREEIK